MHKLPLLQFDTDDIKVTQLYRDDAVLDTIRADSTDTVPQKVKAVYGDVFFPAGREDRPYTYASIVLSSDGKMAWPDDPQGPVIASANALDTTGGKADFWVLNMLRAYADAVIVGARTLQAEPHGTSHVFCGELAAARSQEMKMATLNPLNVVISFDGTDIPLDHMIFDSEGLSALVATSPEGGEYIAQHMPGKPCKVFGPYTSPTKADGDEINASMKANPDTLHVVTTGAGNSPDSGPMLTLLRRMGILRACIESPSYMWHLLQNEKMDEMFINYSMLFVGGTAAMGTGAPFTSKAHPHSNLLMLGRHKSNFIFTRQQIVYGK